MASYGQLLEDGYDPDQDIVYPLFVKYFGDPKMVKLKNVDKFTMYITKIHALLGIEYRYLIVIVREDGYPKGHVQNLANLKWVSLQTRTLSDDYDSPVLSYVPRRSPDIDRKITLSSKDSKQYVYSVEDLPIRIAIIPKTGGGYDYAPTGSVVVALETFQTIVTFV